MAIRTSRYFTPPATVQAPVRSTSRRSARLQRDQQSARDRTQRNVLRVQRLESQQRDRHHSTLERSTRWLRRRVLKRFRAWLMRWPLSYAQTLRTLFGCAQHDTTCDCLPPLRSVPLTDVAFQRVVQCSAGELHARFAQELVAHNLRYEQYGMWHIDHVQALNHFSGASLAELQRAWHYSNLQVLPAHLNAHKSDRVLSDEDDSAASECDNAEKAVWSGDDDANSQASDDCVIRRARSSTGVFGTRTEGFSAVSLHTAQETIPFLSERVVDA